MKMKYLVLTGVLASFSAGADMPLPPSPGFARATITGEAAFALYQSLPVTEQSEGATMVSTYTVKVLRAADNLSQVVCNMTAPNPAMRGRPSPRRTTVNCTTTRSLDGVEAVPVYRLRAIRG